jgi:hypothetical protein
MLPLMLKKLSVPVVILIVLLTWCYPLAAQDNGTPNNDQTAIDFDAIQSELVYACPPLDVVIVVDQSASMSTTDENYLRIAATQSVIDQLYQNAAYVCENRVTHRLAVIGFNDEVFEILPPQTIFIADSTVDAWQDQRDENKASVDTRTLNQEEGETNVYDALLSESGARGILTNWDASTPDDGVDPRQVIILVSDGAPCTASGNQIASPNGVYGSRCRDSDWVDYYFYAQNSTYRVAGVNGDNYAENGFSSPLGLVRDVIRQLANTTQINVILFGTEDVFGGMNNAYTEITNSSGGTYVPPAEIANNRLSDIDAEMSSIVEAVLGSLSTETINACRVQFFIEPYRGSTTIISSVRPSLNSNVEIVDPNSNRISSSTFDTYNASVEYTSSGSRETFVITNPQPGPYTLDGDPLLCDDLRATVSAVNVDSALSDITPVQVAFIDTPNNLTRAEIRLTDRFAGQPFEVLDAHPLNICGHVSVISLDHPNNIPEINANLPTCLPFAPKPDAPGIWQSDPLPAPRQGMYRIQVTGTVKSIQDNSTDISVFAVEGSYATAEETLVRLILESPAEAATTADSSIVRLNDIAQTPAADGTFRDSPLPVAVQMHFEDNIGNRIPLDRLFPSVNDGTGLVTVALQGGVNATLILGKATSNGDRFALAGTVGGSQPNNQLDPPGEYIVSATVTDEAKSNFNRENYAFESAFETDQTIIRRVQLTGILLTADTIPNPVQLNTINDRGQRENRGFEVSVKMVTQTSDDINPQDVFGDALDLNTLVMAYVLNEQNVPVGEPTFLIHQPDSNVFSGLVPPAPTPVNEAGNYAVRFYVNTTDSQLPQDKQLQYTIINGQPLPQQVSITGRPRFGVTLTNASSELVDNSRFQLNTIQNGQQVPSRLDFRVRLVDSTTNAVFDDVSSLTNDVNQLVVFDLIGPDGVSLRSNNPMEYRADINAFTATLTDKLSTVTPTLPIDPAGIYQVTYRFAQRAAPNDLDTYEVRDETVTVQFERYEVRGIRVQLDELAGVTNLPPETEVNVPLFITPWEAMGGNIFPSGATPKDVPYCVSVLDTNNESVDFNSLLQPNILIGEGDGFITIADIMAVRVTSVEDVNTAVPTTLTDAAVGRVCGNIDGAATRDGGLFTLTYGLKDEYLDVESGTIIQTTPPELTLNFRREITQFWLNPSIWIPVEWTGWIVLSVFVVNLMLINFIIPIRSLGHELYVTYKKVHRDDANKPEVIRVRPYFLFAQRFTHPPFERKNPAGNGTVKIKVQVSRLLGAGSLRVNVLSQEDSGEWKVVTRQPSVSRDKPAKTGEVDIIIDRGRVAEGATKPTGSVPPKA